MLQFLKSYLPEVYARLLTALWYVALTGLILYCSLEPNANFRYTAL